MKIDPDAAKHLRRLRIHGLVHFGNKFMTFSRMNSLMQFYERLLKEDNDDAIGLMNKIAYLNHYIDPYNSTVSKKQRRKMLKLLRACKKIFAMIQELKEKSNAWDQQAPISQEKEELFES